MKNSRVSMILHYLQNNNIYIYIYNVFFIIYINSFIIRFIEHCKDIGNIFDDFDDVTMYFCFIVYIFSDNRYNNIQYQKFYDRIYYLGMPSIIQFESGFFFHFASLLEKTLSVSTSKYGKDSNSYRRLAAFVIWKIAFPESRPYLSQQNTTMYYIDN